ncbi:MAG TPA: SRPBCC domain-containing protein [Actinomycetes bacterium]|nr:SRPBCC domain-containing protein [Actinomycetes bacterium]
MEHGSLSRQVYIAASPAVVYQVVSSPEHLATWWVEAAEFEPAPGSTGVLSWGATGCRTEVALTVVEAVPGERFCFRWVYPEGQAATSENSILVTFDLLPQGEGTVLRVTEEGMREKGWDAAVLEEYYKGHSETWGRLLAGLPAYVASLAKR